MMKLIPEFQLFSDIKGKAYFGREKIPFTGYAYSKIFLEQDKINVGYAIIRYEKGDYMGKVATVKSLDQFNTNPLAKALYT